MWGGDLERWQPMGNGAEQWRVVTTASVIDAILPPGDPLTQSNEMWSKGGCQRRCNGETEQFSGSPCLCLAEFGDKWFEQPKGRVCASHSRLKVLLPDMPGLGSWRVETGSYYATDEIAGIVDFIRSAVGEQQLVPVRLRIEARTRVAGGKTKQFVVPVVELRGVTTGQVLAGVDPMAQITGRSTAPQQIASSSSDAEGRIETSMSVGEARLAIESAVSVDEVRTLWPVIQAWHDGVVPDHLVAALKARAKALAAADQPYPAANLPDDSPPGDGPSHAQAWEDCIRAGGEKQWPLGQIKETFTAMHGEVVPASAPASDLVTYAAWLRSDDAAVAS